MKTNFIVKKIDKKKVLLCQRNGGTLILSGSTRSKIFESMNLEVGDVVVAELKKAK